MVCRYVAGASNLPFFPPPELLQNTDIPKASGHIEPMKSPFGDDEVYVVPPLKPDDIAFVARAAPPAPPERTDLGPPRLSEGGGFAAERVIVVCEEIVDESVIRADPNRTVIPGLIVDAVVEEPFACHPSYAQGYYDRDNRFYLDWDAIARDPESLEAWLREWVHELGSHSEYVEKWGDARGIACARRRCPAGELTGRTRERGSCGRAASEAGWSKSER